MQPAGLKRKKVRENITVAKLSHKCVKKPILIVSFSGFHLQQLFR